MMSGFEHFLFEFYSCRLNYSTEILNTSLTFIIPLFIYVLSCTLYKHKQPINALLAFVFICLFFGSLLLYINAEFLGIVFLIVYIGAILILFLFVIMLFRKITIPSFYEEYNSTSFQIFYYAANIIILDKIFKQVGVYSGNNLAKLFNIYEFDRIINNIQFSSKGNLSMLALELYGTYAELLVLIGVLLFVTMVGVIVLIMSVRKQTNF